jgi:cell division protein ZapE
MSPRAHYQEQLATGRLQPDPAQAAVVEELQSLYEDLLRPRPPPSLLERWRRRALPSLPGLYIWGGVGRGKTWLMDLFYLALPLADKRRLHFHRFMGQVQRDLARLKGRANPLQQLAQDLAAQTRVLCLDEVQVWDIGDAMVLGGLLRALFSQGVTLVATSNSAPDGLYPNGLQRTSFLPAIAQIQAHTRVVALDSPIDYRMRFLEQAETYHVPLDAAAEAVLARAFERIAPEPSDGATQLLVNDRSIPIRCQADSILWTDFQALCAGPRSPADYLELARCYHTLLLSGIPCLGDEQNDQAKRFINLVDVLYDHNVTLIASAAAQPEALYQGQGLAFEFQRTASRLREMQSRDWLERPHRG